MKVLFLVALKYNRALRLLQITFRELLAHDLHADRRGTTLGIVAHRIDLDELIKRLKIIIAPLARRPIKLGKRRLVVI